MSAVRGRPAIFLDRDGTLNEAVGYVNHPSRFRLYPWSVDALRLIREEGHLPVVVTNQSGIGRGYFPEALVASLHDELCALASTAGGEIAGVYHCPHAPAAGCSCRKPADGMLRRAAADLDIDLSRSWIVGDTITDLQAGWSAGTRGALVKTGFGEGSLDHESSRWERQPDLVGEDLFRALCAIFWGSAP